MNAFRSLNADAPGARVGRIWLLACVSDSVIGEPFDLTHPHARCVDDRIGIKFERAIGLCAVGAHSANCAVNHRQLVHSRRGENARSVRGGRAGNGDDEPSVVNLTISICDATPHDGGVEPGRQSLGCAGTQMSVRSDRFTA